MHRRLVKATRKPHVLLPPILPIEWTNEWTIDHPYLGAERLCVVEVAAAEVAVLAGGDHTLALDTDAARASHHVTRQVRVLRVHTRVLLLGTDLQVQVQVSSFKHLFT